MTARRRETPEPSGAVSIEIEEEPAEAAREIVLAGLRRYNRRHAEAPDFRQLTLAARTTDGVIVGGLVGDTGWRWLHVALLWVDDAHRGRGIGRALLRAAEREAVQRGCGHASLDTIDFQAPSFYEREGYAVFGTLDGYPPGHRQLYLRKSLAPPAESIPPGD